MRPPVVIARAVVLAAVLGLAWLAPASAQDLNDFLENRATEGTVVDTPAGEAHLTQPADERGAVTAFLDWSSGIGLVGQQAFLYRLWQRLARSYDRYKRLKSVKAEIEQRFGVTLGEGAIEAIPRSKKFEGSDWTLEELEAVRDVLSQSDEGFRRCTRRIFRAQAKPGSPSIYGAVEEGGEDTVFLFDASRGRDPATRDLALFRQVLVHEMTHCWDHANPAVLPEFAARFWIGRVDERAGGEPYCAYVPGIELPPATAARAVERYRLFSGLNGTFPLGGTVTAYAASQERPTGGEDLAETVMAMFGDPALLNDFPERRGFVLAHLSPAMFDRAHIPEMSADPGKYGLFKWKSGATNRHERFPYTFVPSQDPVAWAFLKPDGRAAATVIEEMRVALGLPPFPPRPEPGP